MTGLPSRTAETCSSLRVLPSMAREPRMVRMRLIRRSRGSGGSPDAPIRPIASPILSMRETISGVME